jgi:hypothetical protein
MHRRKDARWREDDSSASNVIKMLSSRRCEKVHGGKIGG